MKYLLFVFAALLLCSSFSTAQVGPDRRGRVIGAQGDRYLYYVGADSRRYVFPYISTPVCPRCYDVFKTWYSDESRVIQVSRSELESYAIGGNVLLRPGSKLIGTTTDKKLYVVGQGEWIHPISEDQALKYYGEDWRDHFMIVPDAFFVNYMIGPNFTGHVNGTMFRYEGEDKIYFLDRGRAREVIADLGFAQEDIFTISREFLYSEWFSISSREEQLVTPAGPVSMFIRGDPNNDRTVDISDVIFVLEYLFLGEKNLPCEDAADMNDDGMLDISDPIYLLCSLFLGIPFSLPWPTTLDYDIKADSLTCLCYQCNLQVMEITPIPQNKRKVTPGTNDVRIATYDIFNHGPTITIDAWSQLFHLDLLAEDGAKVSDLRTVTLKDEFGRCLAGPTAALPDDDYNLGVMASGKVRFADSFQLEYGWSRIHVTVNVPLSFAQVKSFYTLTVPVPSLISSRNNVQIGPESELRGRICVPTPTVLDASVVEHPDFMVEAGQLNVRVIEFCMENNSGEPIRITYLRTFLDSSSKPLLDFYYNWRVATEAGPRATLPPFVDWQGPDGQIKLEFDLIDPIIIEQGSIVICSFICDISTQATGTFHAEMPIDAATAYGAYIGNGVGIKITGSAAGPVITLK